MVLHHHFVRIAKKYKNKPAFVDLSAGKTFSYQRLLTAALVFAEGLKRYEKGFIGIMLPTSAGCAVSVLGALMSGRTPVMINYSTGAYQNAHYAQKKCNFSTIITSKTLLEKIGCPFMGGMVFIEDFLDGISPVQKFKAALMAKLPTPAVLKYIHAGHEDDGLVILFTSGSEKDPKAVEITHKNVISTINNLSRVFVISDEDRMLANLPFFHVFGLTVNLWTALYYGMTIISYANPIDYKKICAISREHKPTILVGSPSFLWGYLRKSEPGDFSSLRFVVNGADKCPEPLRQEFLRKHGLTVLEGYGTTEVPIISVNTHENNKPGSVGRVLPDVCLRIEHYETGDECGVGETGKIMVKGDLVMKGYFDALEETSLHVRGGWYDTGDMGFLDEEGFLWHAGRLKRFVKIGGEMVSLTRVESLLCSILPDNVSCCVVEIPEALKGARIIAVVTEKIDEKKIIKQLSEHLPAIALPRQVVVMEELPTMGSGKIDFRTVTDRVYEMIHKNPPMEGRLP
jgi:acyl-[acyl-carrier-protein]-phospholipid O-acyltransferase/long-chain-fatty-acid--[acyl-carrier-protein] ligase